ncbi:MAG: 4Fe-4S binding protein [Bacillota bacterium]|nr:4Fe-4S binding protein [Bacillota bacterium]
MTHQKRLVCHTGRLVCGWLCPFGFFQELLARLSKRKLPIPRVLTFLKYPVLLLTLLLPIIWIGDANVASPYFCKYLCPTGTLEAGLPLGLLKPELHPLLGAIFSWKVFVLLFFTLTSIITFRPFCRTICPLGAFYALFNAGSLWRLEISPHRCISCGHCQEVCPMDIDVLHNPNSPECIRCMRCKNACPTEAIVFSVKTQPQVIDVIK